MLSASFDIALRLVLRRNFGSGTLASSNRPISSCASRPGYPRRHFYPLHRHDWEYQFFPQFFSSPIWRYSKSANELRNGLPMTVSPCLRANKYFCVTRELCAWRLRGCTCEIKSYCAGWLLNSRQTSNTKYNVITLPVPVAPNFV